MAVGDSVTVGSGSAVSGYRTVVNNRMKVDALQAVWVGSQTTKLPLHEAYSGISDRANQQQCHRHGHEQLPRRYHPAHGRELPIF